MRPFKNGKIIIDLFKDSYEDFYTIEKAVRSNIG